MAGVKGQKNPSKHKRLNRYSAGTVEPIRESEVFAFKIAKELYPRVKQEIEERGISKQVFADGLLACYYAEESEGDFVQNDEQRVEIGELPLLVRDAIATSIQLKQAAISREKKAKRPDEVAIARWQAEIEELEAVIG